MTNTQLTNQPNWNTIKYVVYRDESYPTSWISIENSKTVADYLKDNARIKVFQELNATDLKDWMNSLVERKNANEYIVVFSQDVIPITVYNDKSDNLVREFLYYGGTILWMGDIPFLILGKDNIDIIQEVQGKEVRKNIKKPTQLGMRPNDVYAIFGSSPSFAFSDMKVKLTKNGKKIGLKHQWYSMRPMNPKYIGFPFIRGELVLAKSILSHPVKEQDVNPQKYRGEGSDLFSTMKGATEFISGYINLGIVLFALAAATGGVAWSFNLLGIQQLLTLVMPSTIGILIIALLLKKYRRKRFSSAWVKQFENGGKFFRIWDYRPEKITNDMCIDLYNIATKGLEKEY